MRPFAAEELSSDSRFAFVARLASRRPCKVPLYARVDSRFGDGNDLINYGFVPALCDGLAA